MIVELGEKEIIVRRISTHIDARDVIEIINNTLERKDIKMIYNFEGSPGPLGEGIVIKIKLSKKLSNVDISVLRKIFELKGIPVKVNPA
ncbi:MAG: hypothetical protein B6U75_03560 [Desulfurococcales archaeon ex4484_217_1]|nr:MAG: hypothetical protein B6U75_03560 [Desulfurococcales archaeon ex4484_217_1]